VLINQDAHDATRTEGLDRALEAFLSFKQLNAQARAARPHIGVDVWISKSLVDGAERT
jgi:hypothetical protein